MLAPRRLFYTRGVYVLSAILQFILDAAAALSEVPPKLLYLTTDRKSVPLLP